MRVLILHELSAEPGKGGGGAESMLRDQTESLRRLGHDVAWLQTGEIARAVDAFKPDVVQVQTIHTSLGLGPARWLQSNGVPHVWALMDYWPFCRGRMLLVDGDLARDPRRCPAIDGACDGKCSRGRTSADWLATVNGSPVVALNEYQAAINRRNGLRADYVVELGIDTARFAPDHAKRTPEVSIWASSAWAGFGTKGIDVLGRAVRGTPYNANVMSGLPREKVAEGLKRCHIYVFPSTYEETWGLCLTEAMASGCACIASDVAGPRAQLHDGMGVLVPPRDAAALREVIETLQGDERQRRDYGERAAAHVATEHSLEAMGRRWEAVYQHVMGRS